MTPPKQKAPPKKRNLAAFALRDPLFKRRKRFTQKPVDTVENDEMN